MATHATDRVYGCMIGGAIGDALGAAVEGWSYEQIRREYGKVEEFKKLHRAFGKETPGAVTTDTTLRHYVAYAIVENGRRVTPNDVAEVLIEQLNPDRVWVNSEIIVKKLSAGINPWVSGEGTISDTKVLSAITPVGVVNAGNPTQAFQDGFNVGSVFQSGHDRDAAATVAAGIAEALTPDATVERVVSTMMEHAPSVVYRGIDLALGIAENASTVEEFVESYYDRRLDWRWPAVQWDREKYYQGRVFSASSTESLPITLAILSLCDGEVNRSVVEGASFGRDSDAIASTAGSIAGAIAGTDGIRADWMTRCERANVDLFRELEGDPDANFRRMADRLIEVLENERRWARDREQQLGRLLEADRE